MIRLFAILFSILCSVIAVSAQSMISFGVYDREDKEPVAGALATLLCTSDSTLRKAVLADGNGRVALPADSAQWRSIVVSCLGYENEIVKASRAQDSIFLSKKANELGELVVNHQMLTSAPGKFIFSPGELRDRKSNVLEVAQLTPLVNFRDGQASVLGRGQAAIRINGRDLKMSAEDMTDYLNALPADRVKTIEVVVQPGSDEGSDGANAIVNIILNNPAEGLLGSVSLSGERDGHSYTGRTSLWLGYTKGKFSLSGTVSPSYRNSSGKSRSTYHYTIPEKRDVDESIENNSDNVGMSGSLSGEYNINERSNAGITLRMGGGKYKGHGDAISIENISGTEATTSRMHTIEDSPWNLGRIGGIAYYTLTTDSKGSSFDVTADYAVKHSIYDYSYTGGADVVNQHTTYNRKGLSLKPSYLWMISDRHMVKAGYDYYYGKTQSRDTYNVIANDFRYQENIHSVYAQWMALWSDAFSMSAGLRMEDAHTRGSSESGAAGFERHDTYLIPTLSLDVKLPWYDNSVSINFSRIVSRPFYQKLNPAMVQTSPTTYTIGNPYLKNSAGWSGSVYYTLLKSLTCVVMVSYSPNAAFDYTYDRDGMTVTGCENLGSLFWFNPGMSYSRSFGNLYLKSSLDVLYSRYKAMLDGIDLSESSWKCNFRVDADYTISKKHRISMEGFYSVSSGSKMPGRYETPRHILEVGASKRWKSGWRMSLEIFNILNSKNRQHFNSQSYSYSIVNPYDEVNVSLSVRYNFGKQTVKAVQGRQYNELDLH